MSLSTRERGMLRPTIKGARKAAASVRFSIRDQLPPHIDAFLGFMGILVFVALWCLFSYGNLVSRFALPTPTSIVKTFIRLYESGQLLMPIWRSLWRVLRALFFVTLIGLPIGVLMGAFAPIDAFLRK